MSSILTFAIIAAIAWFLQNLNPSKLPRRTESTDDEFSTESGNSVPDWLSEWTQQERQRAGGKVSTKAPRRQSTQQTNSSIAKQDTPVYVPPVIATPVTESNRQAVESPAIQLVTAHDQLVQGMIWSEILQKPKALRPRR